MHHPSSAPPAHCAFLDHAVPLLARDDRVLGIAVAGSYAANAMDAYSDLDLVVACEPGDLQGLLGDRAVLAARLGVLVAAFTGEHVGEPRLLICLYADPALHVDIKVVPLGDLHSRVDEPVVLWEREQRMSEALAKGRAAYPPPDAQWIEDRFWVWVHYGALKIGRGELQEALDFLSFLRVTAIGPLGLARAGLTPAGVRRVEQDPGLAQRLGRTVAQLDRLSLIAALENAVDLYRDVRPASIVFRRQAEAVAADYLSALRDAFKAGC
jgi:predicted nucleotidyltransferase